MSSGEKYSVSGGRQSAQRDGGAQGRNPPRRPKLFSRQAGQIERPLAILDQIVLAVFLAYAVHVVIAPMDSQVVVEQGAMKVLDYGQLINGSYGQVAFLAYLGLRSLSVPAVYRALLNPLGGLAIFAVLSTAWSVEPLTTLHRAFDLVLCVLMPALLVATLGFERCLRTSWIVMCGILLVSVALALAGSDYALMKGHHVGLWRGVFDHKNTFAPFAATVAVLSFLMPVHIVPSALLRRGAGAIAVGAVLAAGSATSMVGLAVAGLAIALSKLCQRLGLSPFKTFVTMTGSIGGGGIAAFAIAAAILHFLGRSVTLTGRTGLWEAAMPFTLSHPFGYGYGLDGGEAVLNAVRLQSGWLVAPSLHSGYITLAMDLGWPAAIVFTLYLLSKVLILVWREKTTDSYILMAVGLAALNLSLAFSESAFGAYLNVTLIFIAMIGRTKRGFYVQQYLRIKPSPNASPATSRTGQRRHRG